MFSLWLNYIVIFLIYYYFIMNNDNILQFLNRERRNVFLLLIQKELKTIESDGDSINNQ